MRSLHGYLLLIWPRPAEFPLCTDQKSGWISINEQLRYRAAGQPVRVGIHDLADVFRFSLYWQFSRPCQHWLPQRAGVSVVAAIDFHCFLGYAPERQEILYEKILLKDYLLPGWCALRLE